MPFPITEDLIAATEQMLGARLPSTYRAAIARSNGGEVEVAQDVWRVHPLEDRSDRKRVGRTANHIVLETNRAREWEHFPPNALSMASNGTGDLLLLLKQGTAFAEPIYLWSHEDGTISRVANAFSELKGHE